MSDADCPFHVEPDGWEPRIFDQDKYWIDERAEPHRLDEMTKDYLNNVVAFLLLHAPAKYDSYLWEFDQERGRHLLELALSGGPQALLDAAQNWLEDSPLMRKLRELTDTAVGHVDEAARTRVLAEIEARKVAGQ